MTLIMSVSLIMNNDGTNLCKVFYYALCLCIKSHNVMTSWVKWENVRINWRINSISDSFEILWWAQLWFNKKNIKTYWLLLWEMIIK